MSKALESALEAVRRMSPGSEIDPVHWRLALEEIATNAAVPSPEGRRELGMALPRN